MLLKDKAEIINSIVNIDYYKSKQDLNEYKSYITYFKDSKQHFLSKTYEFEHNLKLETEVNQSPNIIAKNCISDIVNCIDINDYSITKNMNLTKDTTPDDLINVFHSEYKKDKKIRIIVFNIKEQKNIKWVLNSITKEIVKTYDFY